MARDDWIVDPGSQESKRMLKYGWFFAVGWFVWYVLVYCWMELYKTDTIISSIFLVYGLLQMSDQFLALFSFWNLFPFIVIVT